MIPNLMECFFSMLTRKCDQNIQKTLELAEQMILLAQRGDDAREDASCGVLYGTLLDAGYKLKQLALKEKEAHIGKGWWNKPARKTKVEEHIDKKEIQVNGKV